MIAASYILSGLSLVSMISASLVKGERIKTILILVFCGNFFAATSYLFTGSGINGAAACYLGALQTLINYFFDSKGKKIPIWLTVIYCVAIIVLNIVVAKGITGLGVLVIVASLTFVLCIGQENGKMYRFWTIVNMLLWCTHDIIATTYAPLMQHTALLIFTVTGMIIHDRKNLKSTKQ